MTQRTTDRLIALLFFILPFNAVFMAGKLPLYLLKYGLIAVLWLLAIYGLRKIPPARPNGFMLLLAFPAAYFLGAIPSLLLNQTDYVSLAKHVCSTVAISAFPLVYYFSSRRGEPFMSTAFRYLLIGIVLALIFSTAHFLGTSWTIPKGNIILTRRLYGVFMNPNNLALFSFVGVLCALLAAHRGWITLRVMTFLMTVELFGFFASVSKASFIAAALVVPFYFLLSKRWKILWPRNTWRLVIFSMLSGFILATAAISMKHSSRPESFNPDDPVLDALRIKPDILSTGSRLELWKGGLEVWLDNPVFGVGKENWGRELEERGVIWMSRRGPVRYSSPHNGFLEVAGGLGIPGIVIYIAFPLLLLWAFVRRGSVDAYSITFFAMLLFYICREIFGTSNLYTYSQNSILFWSVSGLLLSGVGRGDDRNQLYHDFQPA